jgi:PAS domain S-box-containing protein
MIETRELIDRGMMIIDECNSHGQMLSLLASLPNIDDRQHAEEALHAIGSALESAVEGIAWLNTQGYYLSVNRAYAKILGYEPEEMLGMSWQPTVYPEDLPRVLSAYEQMLADGKVELEVRGVRKDGSLFYKSLVMVTAYDRQQHFSGHYCFAKDITDRKQAEDALQLSEERLQLALEGSGDGLWDWNIATGDVYLSPRWLQMLGYEENELPYLVRTWQQLIHPDDREWVIDVLNAHLKDSTSPYTFDYRLRTKSGEWKWIANYGKVVVRDSNGNPLRMAGTHRDITDRKLAERKIQEQAALLDIATDAIFVRDIHSRILFWNRGAERMYGWSAAEAIGRDARTMLYKDFSVPAVRAAWTTVLANGEWQGELNKLTQSGREILVTSRWSLVRDPQGQPKFILTVDTDITEKKQLEAQFIRAQRLESLGTLTSGLANDLNNILTPILISTQLLQLKIPSENQYQQRLLTTIERNTKRGADLARQVLSFIQGMKGLHVSLKVTHLLSEIVQLARQRFPPSIAICEDVPSHLWMVSADAEQLHQVLMNLCVNAQSAMPDGGTLTISAANVMVDEPMAKRHLDAKVGSYVVVSVRDTGTGIPHPLLDRIFEPFFTTRELGQGAGLGLSIVMGTIKSHGGFVTVSSGEGQGTQFDVYLPARSQ